MFKDILLTAEKAQAELTNTGNEEMTAKFMDELDAVVERYFALEEHKVNALVSIARSLARIQSK